MHDIEIYVCVCVCVCIKKLAFKMGCKESPYEMQQGKQTLTWLGLLEMDRYTK